MENLSPSMRLKLNSDVHVLPDEDGSVYFRNNEGSFRMEGKSVGQWIEKLMPVFNGNHTLASLTDDLPALYGHRIYEIASVLYNNGFVRDVSGDAPHQLTFEVERTFASQIELLDNVVGSGASRFETFRKTKVLAVGDGELLVSLVSALFNSGHPDVHILLLGREFTNCERLTELANHARRSDPEAKFRIIRTDETTGEFHEVMAPFDVVLYVSRLGDIENLELIASECEGSHQLFLPAVFVNHVGIVGPFVRPLQNRGWTSLWQRIHEPVFELDPALHAYSSTASAVLANVAVFEFFKAVTGLSGEHASSQVYLLNLETLEGAWHSFLPHPEAGTMRAEEIKNLGERLALEKSDSRSVAVRETLAFFGQIVGAVTGIFHVWDEGDLLQLPLAQCRVQVASPFSDGPAKLSSETVSRGLTHEEARCLAGLRGIEQYAESLLPHVLLPNSLAPNSKTVTAESVLGIGAGRTCSEGIWRGLQKCVREMFQRRNGDSAVNLKPVQLRTVDDARCIFYLESLSAERLNANIALDEDVLGFPVVWVEVKGQYFSGVGNNITVALQSALEEALMANSGSGRNGAPSIDISGEEHMMKRLIFDQEQEIPIVPLDVPAASTDAVTADDIESLLSTVRRHGVTPMIFDLSVEPFMSEVLAGVFAVVLRWEEEA